MLKLIATSGDLSASGMGNTATVIEVTEDQALLIEMFQAYSKALSFEAFSGEASPTLQDVRKYMFHQMVEAQAKLFDQGVFKNKYYARTKWSLA